MHYGDEYMVEVSREFDPADLSRTRLEALFRNARRLTAFASAPDGEFIHAPKPIGVAGLLCYRIDSDRIIEINEAVLHEPVAIRNTMRDLITFQFVSSVKRSEFLGKRKNIHDLGPALLVSVIPRTETTYRVPKPDVQIRHVAIHTTLSSLMARLAETPEEYPDWLQEMLDGTHTRPRQRVFFLDDVHGDAIWSCFQLPVEGSLLGKWMTAKFDELLCIGMQLLKSSRTLPDRKALDLNRPFREKIRQARRILGMEYANPPAIPTLAKQLGISETRLKSGFKAVNGTTLMQYCIEKRIEAARFLLAENRHSIAEIGSIVGYEDPSAFSRAFRRACGCTPREWRSSRRH
jgi:AraC-like DNA-binding protein